MLREDWVQQPTEREYTKRTRDDSTGSVSAVLVASTAMMNTTQQELSHIHVIATVQGTMIRGTRQIWRAWRRVLTIPMVGLGSRVCIVGGPFLCWRVFDSFLAS